MKKYSLDFVTAFCLDRNIRVLSSSYLNCGAKMKFECIICSNVWFTSFSCVMHNSTGCPECAKKNKMISIETVNSRILKVHGNLVTLVENTYINTKKQCCFVDAEYGEWWATPSNVFQGQRHPKKVVDKRRKTCLERYGVDSVLRISEVKTRGMLKKYGVMWPTQDKNIRLKGAITANKITSVKHWSSHESILCQGSYEVATVNYFNKNKINYNWQPKTFPMPDGRTYTPDCFLPICNLWIEIKGYFRKDAEEKWNWFHASFPNSELWNKDVLHEKGILK